MGIFNIHLPKDINVTLTIKQESDNPTLELLIQIKNQILKLMSTLTDIQADIATLGTTLDTLLTAIQGLSAGIDPNGISAADAAALKTSLDTLVAKAQADLAAIPAATPPPPTV